MIQLFNLYVNHAFQILTVLWIIAITRSILFWLNYIQIKQYRLDRIFSELKHVQFYKLVFSSYRSVLIGFFITWQILLRTSVTSQFGAFDLLLTAIIIFFAFQAYTTIRHLLNRSLQIPIFTTKIWIIFIVLIIGQIWVASIYKFWPEQLLAIEIIQPFIVLAVFGVLYIPNYLMQRNLMQSASEKVLALKHVQVIGITGSYGKTSMKEFLNHILSQKYSVLSTPNHVNVDTGIARLVLDELTDQYDYFIVEMGAYREHEIKRICDIVHPNFGIMTGLGDQHLELFGSQEILEKTKFELVDAVNNQEHTFANSESKLLNEAFKKRSIQPISYGFNDDANYQGKIVSATAEKTIFTIGEETFTAPVFGQGHMINLLGAIAVAKKLGMSMKEISEAIASMPSVQRTMEKQDGPNGSTLIDDSYNANTEGIILSLDDLRISDYQKKIIVFKEVIELGEASSEDHRRIANKMLESVDYIMFLPGQEALEMRKHLLESGFDKQHLLHYNDLDKLRDLLDSQTIVLFEGRGTEQILLKLQA